MRDNVRFAMGPYALSAYSFTILPALKFGVTVPVELCVERKAMMKEDHCCRFLQAGLI